MVNRSYAYLMVNSMIWNYYMWAGDKNLSVIPDVQEAEAEGRLGSICNKNKTTSAFFQLPHVS